MRKWLSPLAVLVAIVILCVASAAIAKTDKTVKHSAKDTKTAPKSTLAKKSQPTQKASTRAKAKETKHADKASAHKKQGKGQDGKHQAAPVPRRAEAQPESYKGEFQLGTKAALLMDMATSRVLYAQEPDLPIPPASLTKVLTLYLVNESIQAGALAPDQNIPVSQDASHAGGSTMRLRTGEMVSVSELIKGIAVASANDGCVAVAEYLGRGDQAVFVGAMNQKAKELGMRDSQFLNPNGLPAEGQVTTARDMATLAKRYLDRFPEALAIHSMTEIVHNNRVRHNSNSLLGKVEGVDGLKTGFVCASGFNIVVTAKRGDTRLVAVVLGARSRGVREREATRLIEEGFKIVAAEARQAHQQVAMNPGADARLR